MRLWAHSHEEDSDLDDMLVVADKSPSAYRTISEVATVLKLPQHVLRFWETKFPQIKPLKRAGGRRFYKPDDVDLLRGIRHLLYSEGYTIKGVQKLIKSSGVKFVQNLGHPVAPISEPSIESQANISSASSVHNAEAYNAALHAVAARAPLFESVPSVNITRAELGDLFAATPVEPHSPVIDIPAAEAPFEALHNLASPHIEVPPAKLEFSRAADAPIQTAAHILDNDVAQLQAVLADLMACRTVLTSAR